MNVDNTLPRFRLFICLQVTLNGKLGVVRARLSDDGISLIEVPVPKVPKRQQATFRA